MRSGEEGRRSRCRPGPVRCQTSPKERPYGGLSRRQQNDVVGRCLLISVISAAWAIIPTVDPAAISLARETSCARHGITAMPSAISDEADQTVPVGDSALGLTRSDYVDISKSESNDAISASGALNRPRLSSGGTTASTASNFSDGSMRR